MDAAPQPSTSDASSDVQSISMQEFLEFLKLSCQMHELRLQQQPDDDTPNDAAGIANKSGAVTSTVNLNELSQNPLINSLMASKPTVSRTASNGSSGNCLDRRDSKKRKAARKSSQSSLHPALEYKLNEVIDEGILDSVLQYMCPAPTTTTTTTPAVSNGPSQPVANAVGKSHVGDSSMQGGALVPSSMLMPTGSSSSSGVRGNNPSDGHMNQHGQQPSGNGREAAKMSRRKSVNGSQPNGDTLVTIHVCDEVKNVSRDFVCPQALLVEKMGYFEDVTAGQRLEDMDISVHCDVQIFEWLMRWVKRDESPEMWPRIDANNVVPILVSASFLQMEPLLVDCLAFCHANLGDVVRASANTGCLNDAIIGRLAAMFTNAELEAVRDKRERVTPRLWCKLIQSLCEPEAQQLRGHYASTADLFRCVRCGQYMTLAVASYVHCTPQSMRMNRWGQIVSKHTRDAGWSLTNYASALYKELRSWRAVYWRLWGSCHFLYCVICETHFPVSKMKWCLYHPEAAQFLGPATEGRMAGPAGRYPCCGQQAFRYEPLPGPIGCQYREHTVQLETDRDRAILKLCQQLEEGGCLYEPTPPHGNPAAHQHSEQWWQGVQLAPNRTAHGLLPPLQMGGDGGHAHYASSAGAGGGGGVGSCHRFGGRDTSEEHDDEESSSDADSSSITLEQFMSNQTSSSDGYESDSCAPSKQRVTKLATTSTAAAVGRQARPKKPLKLLGRHWSSDISARSNQDNQREFEERAMKQVIAMVGKRTGSDTNLRYQHHLQGGKYVKLESEWRESVRQKLAQVKAKK